MSFSVPAAATFLLFLCSLSTGSGRQVALADFNGDTFAYHNHFSPTVNGNIGCAIWSLANPDTGSAYDLSVTGLGAPSPARIVVVSLSDVDLTTPLGTMGTKESGSGTSADVDVASTADGLVFDIYSANKPTTGAGSGQTQHYGFSGASPDSSSSRKNGDGGTVNMSYTKTSGYWAMAGVNVNAAAAAAVKKDNFFGAVI